MLDDPRAKDGVDEFVSEWLRFDRVMSASRERRLYPAVQPGTGEVHDRGGQAVHRRSGLERPQFHGSVHGELQLHQLGSGGGLQGAAACARLSNAWSFRRESERAGLLGQALFLTLSSKPDDTAPTGRGLFVREQFLCQQVPPPPPGVDTNLPPVEESKPVTNRERMAMHATNRCAPAVTS